MQTKIQAIMNELNIEFLEREEQIKAAVIAILAGEHLLMLGPPGTGKSALVRAIVKHIQGAEQFELLLDSFSTPEQLVGAYDIPALSQGQYVRRGQGMIQGAQFAFLDEVYKANSAVLNTLLALINERVLHEAGHIINCPLITLFGASNESPQDESLKAFHDRFLIKIMFARIVDRENLKKMLRGKIVAPTCTKVTLDEITALQKHISTIQLTDVAADLLCDLQYKLAEIGVVASDRTWHKCIKILQANAWLNGRNVIETEDLDILIHCLWSDVEEIKKVQQVVLDVANPLQAKAIEFLDQAKELLRQVPRNNDANFSGKMENIITQVKDIYVTLEETIKNSTTTRKNKANNCLNKIGEIHNQIAKMALDRVKMLNLGVQS